MSDENRSAGKRKKGGYEEGISISSSVRQSCESFREEEVRERLLSRLPSIKLHRASEREGEREGGEESKGGCTSITRGFLLLLQRNARTRRPPSCLSSIRSGIPGGLIFPIPPIPPSNGSP